MARKPIVDRDHALEMLREGRSTQQVADYFAVSRQAMDLHRRDFISRGLLKDERATRAPKGGPAAVPAAADSTGAASLDDLIELLITAFTALKRVPELEAQLDQYKDAYKRTLQEVERLTAEAKRRQEQELRWRAAHQPAPQSPPDPA